MSGAAALLLCMPEFNVAFSLGEAPSERGKEEWDSGLLSLYFLARFRCRIKILGVESDKDISIGLLPMGSKAAIYVSEGWNNI